MTDAHEFRLIIKGPDTSWEVTIPEGSMIIGRQIGNDLLLEHPQISRMHARIDCFPQACHITDLNSSNGTFVNEEKVTPDVQIRLKPGDTIKIGPFILEVGWVAVDIQKPEEQPATKEFQAPPISDDIPIEKTPDPLEAADKSIEPEKRLIPESEHETPKSPPRPPQIPPGPPPEDLPIGAFTPPGISKHSTRLLHYLPDIYHTDFLSRFLAIFESILTPIEWNIDNFDLYLEPGTTPTEFIPWLANLFQISFDPTWREEQRRELLEQAHNIFARRGTQWALNRVLEIYTGFTPEIIDQGEKQDPFTFSVKLPISKKETNPELIEALINANKPAHTTYEIHFKTR